MTNQLDFAAFEDAMSFGSGTRPPSPGPGYVWSEILQKWVPRPKTTAAPAYEDDPASFIDYGKPQAPAPAAPANPFQPVSPAIAQNFRAGVNRGLSAEGALADDVGLNTPLTMPQLGGGLGRLAGDAFGLVKDAGGPLLDLVADVPFREQVRQIPGVGQSLGAVLQGSDAATQNTTTLGDAASFAIDEQGNPGSRFIGSVIRPRAAAAGEVAGELYGLTPFGAVTDTVLNTAGAGFDTGDVGRTVGDYGTPVSPLDLALSLAIPATSDWADVIRFARGAGLIDDAGRMLRRVLPDDIAAAALRFNADELGNIHVPGGGDVGSSSMRLPIGTEPEQAHFFANEGSWFHGGRTQEIDPERPFFVTRDPEAAKFYADRGPDRVTNPSVGEYDVQLQNPAHLEDIEESAQRLGITPEEVARAGGSDELAFNFRTNREDLANPNDYLYVKRLRDDLRRRGFDGAQGWDVFTNYEIPFRVPFDPPKRLDDPATGTLGARPRSPSSPDETADIARSGPPSPGGAAAGDAIQGTPNLPAEQTRWIHGTRSNIDQFKTDSLHDQLGVFFTSNPRYASQYTEETTKGAEGAAQFITASVRPQRTLNMLYGQADIGEMQRVADTLKANVQRVQDHYYDVGGPAPARADSAIRKAEQAKEMFAAADSLEAWKAADAKLLDASLDASRALYGNDIGISNRSLREAMLSLGYDSIRKAELSNSGDFVSDTFVALDPSIVSITGRHTDIASLIDETADIARSGPPSPGGAAAGDAVPSSPPAAPADIPTDANRVPPPPDGSPPSPPDVPVPEPIPPSLSGIEKARSRADQIVPNIPSAIRRTLGKVVPPLNYPREVVVASRAYDDVHAQVIDWTVRQVDAAHSVQDAWKLGAPVYKGSSDVTIANTPIHWLENPWDYEGASEVLTAARKVWDDAFDGTLARLADEYGVAIDPFYTTRNGIRNSYVPHMDSQAMLDAAKKQKLSGVGTGRRTTSRVSIQKERGIPTIDKRMADDETWDPELDLLTLATRHGVLANDAAARATYKTLIPGKTGTEILEATHPELLRMRNRLSSAVSSIRQRLKVQEIRTGVRQSENAVTERRLLQLQARADDMSVRVANMGDEFGPELSHLSGELYEMNRQLRAGVKYSEAQKARIVNGLEQTMDLLDRYMVKAEQLSDLRATVAAANTKRVVENGEVINYAFDPVTNKWTRPEIAQASHAISNTDPGSLTRFLEEARAVQLNAGDFSPLTFGRAQMGALANPAAFPKSVREMVKAMNQGDDYWRGVDQAYLEVYQAYRGRSVTRPLAEIRPTDAERGLEKVIPKLRTANDFINRLATTGDFAAWELQTRAILRQNPAMTLEEAGIAAGKAMDNIAPRIDLANFGFSQAASRSLNAPLTSLSYALSAPRFVGAMGKSSASLATNLVTKGMNPVDAWRALSVADQQTLIHGMEMMGTISMFAAASNVAFNDEAGLSIEDKILQSVTPVNPDGSFNGDFWKLKLPGGYSIAIASPLRSGISAGIRTATDGPDAVLNYGINRTASIPNYVVSMLRNQDWKGDPIRTGDDNWKRIQQSLLYGLESANISTSPVFRSIRTGEPEGIGEVLFEAGTNQLGFNVTEPSVWNRTDRAIRSDIRDGKIVDSDGNLIMTYLDNNGHEQPINHFWQLKGANPEVAAQWLIDNPDLAEDRLGESGKEAVRANRYKQEANTKQAENIDPLLATNPREWRIRTNENAETLRVQQETVYAETEFDNQERTLLDVANTEFQKLIEENTADDQVVDWDAVFAGVSEMEPEKQDLLFKQRLAGETDTVKQYIRDLELIGPYFDIRDESWREFVSGDPELSQYRSQDAYVVARHNEILEEYKDFGLSRDEAMSMAESEVEFIASTGSLDAKLFLLDNPHIVTLLDKYGWNVPNDLRFLVGE